MSIVTISRGSYSRGEEVAEKLALALGYECISREVILEASEYSGIPEAKLVRAIHDAPSFLERFSYGKEKYVAHIRAAIMRHVQKDNVVYHGLAGHFFLQEVPHVLKVRIIASLEDRIKEEMKREKISPEEARRILIKDDEERRKWSLALYGIDTWDSALYDMVLHIKTMTVEDAVDLILHNLGGPFATTPESQASLDNLTLAAQVEAVLIESFPGVKASAKDGVVFVSVTAPLSQRESAAVKAEAIAKRVPGVREVEIYVVPIVTPD
jgi:cytidylate kinase